MSKYTGIPNELIKITYNCMYDGKYYEAVKYIIAKNIKQSIDIFESYFNDDTIPPYITKEKAYIEKIESLDVEVLIPKECVDLEFNWEFNCKEKEDK